MIPTFPARNMSNMLTPRLINKYRNKYRLYTKPVLKNLKNDVINNTTTAQAVGSSRLHFWKVIIGWIHIIRKVRFVCAAVIKKNYLDSRSVHKTGLLSQQTCRERFQILRLNTGSNFRLWDWPIWHNNMKKGLQAVPRKTVSYNLHPRSSSQLDQQILQTNTVYSQLEFVRFFKI